MNKLELKFNENVYLKFELIKLFLIMNNQNFLFIENRDCRP